MDLSEDVGDAAAFHSVDFDACRDLANVFGVVALPSLVAYRSGAKLGLCVAGSKDILSDFVNHFVPLAPTESDGHGSDAKSHTSLLPDGVQSPAPPAAGAAGCCADCTGGDGHSHEHGHGHSHDGSAPMNRPSAGAAPAPPGAATVAAPHHPCGKSKAAAAAAHGHHAVRGESEKPLFSGHGSFLAAQAEAAASLRPLAVFLSGPDHHSRLFNLSLHRLEAKEALSKKFVAVRVEDDMESQASTAVLYESARRLRALHPGAVRSLPALLLFSPKGTLLDSIDGAHVQYAELIARLKAASRHVGSEVAALVEQ